MDRIGLFKFALFARQLCQFSDEQLLFEIFHFTKKELAVAWVTRRTASSEKRPSLCFFMILRTRAMGNG